MIRVNQLISRARTGRCNKPRMERIADVTIAARDARRTVEFYTRVFGFRFDGGATRSNGTVVLVGPGHAHLAIHGYSGNAARPVPIRRQWGFIVDDLERVRDAVWDLGVGVSKDSGDPDQIFRRPDGRSLFIKDPDDNEIELIEDGKAGDRVAGLRNCGRSFGSWRRRARPGCEAVR